MTDDKRQLFGLEVSNDAASNMASREVRRFLNARHGSVRRTIERLVKRDTIEQRPLVDVQETGANGPSYTRSHYRLVERTSLTVTAQMNPLAATAIVDRSQELEAQPALPDFSGMVTSACAWADQVDHNAKMADQIADMNPRVAVYDQLDASEGAMSIRIAAKMLDEPERKLIRWLVPNDWAFRQREHGPLQTYAQRIKARHLEHKLSQFLDLNTGGIRSSSTLMVTPKGMALLAKHIAKGVFP